MAIIPITKEHIDTVTLEMHPERMFASSSKGGITGSVYVYANRSPFNKQRIESAPFAEYAVDPESTSEELILSGVAFNASSYEAEWDTLVAGNALPTVTITETSEEALGGAVTVYSDAPTIVVGTGTSFSSDGIKDGDDLKINGETVTIASVDSDTQLTLTTPLTVPAATWENLLCCGSSYTAYTAYNTVSTYDYRDVTELHCNTSSGCTCALDTELVIGDKVRFNVAGGFYDGAPYPDGYNSQMGPAKTVDDTGGYWEAEVVGPAGPGHSAGSPVNDPDYIYIHPGFNFDFTYGCSFAPYCDQYIGKGPLSMVCVEVYKLGSVTSGVIKIVTTSSEVPNTDRLYAYETYLTKVNDAKQSPELNKYMEIWRFKPSFSFTSNTLRKNVVKDSLFKYYSGQLNQLDWAYSNYNCLTFFTASEITPNSALIYPAPSTGKTLNQYINTSSFSLSFWLNPRRTTTTDRAEYKAGTVLHSSSSFAVSLVTGSEKDDYGNPEAFRILLQLSQSADLPPSDVDLTIANNMRSWPNDLIFLSEDNSLKLNTWHHVTISWSSTHSFGTGSIWIDNVEKTRSDFLVPSTSLNVSHLTDFVPLIVGNYYNSDNTYDSIASYRTMAKFFNAGAASKEGTPSVGPSAGQIIPPTTLDHKLNADVHDLRIYDKFLPPAERKNCMMYGPENLNNLLFYLPPYFVKESPYRTIQTTPYFTKMTASDTPFNVDLSFGVGGHDLSIENFTRDFVNGIYPRHFCLTSSIVTADTMYATANQINWERNDYKDYFRARQLLLLPCDNGKFEPNFSLLASGTYAQRPIDGTSTDRFIDDQGYLDYSLVSLRNLVSTGSAEDIDPGINYDTAKANDIAEFLAGGSNYNPDFMTRDDDGPTPYALTVIQRTLDNSSNELYFFDVSNLFYGNRILPGSFVIEDVALTGSAGAVGIKIKDNAQGNLYRGDCIGDAAKWNSVGNILYDEGIIVVKSPNIPLFGQDQFKISFTGLHNVHSYEVNVILSPNLFTSSSNPTFVHSRPDDYVSDIESKYVAFNSIHLHDDNLNVITRTNLAQPIIKKLGDKYLVRIKIDY